MKRFSLILLLMVAGGFVFGLVKLFNLRFEAGDVYPRYSSFRADPLGTKALYESLEPLVPTSRHLRQLSKLRDGGDTALLYLGVEPDDLKFRKDEFQRLETFVASGGRLVISLVTQYKTRARPPSPPGYEDALVEAKERWGFDFDYARLPREEGQYQHPVARNIKEDSSLPPELLWHSAIYFTNLHTAWQTVYVISNDLPVLIERQLGAGQIVLCSDSYFWSNEALLAERHATLLSRLIGPVKRVIFDETHLGVREEPGLATLFRRYRLHGLAAALLILALLFIWKSSDTFVPGAGLLPTMRAHAVTGRGAATGFVNLLRRNISRGELIGVCINEWKRSRAHGTGHQRLQQVQAVIDAENELPAAKRDPLRIYQSLSRILASRKNSIS